VNQGDRAIVLGVISDTHGLLRPEALAALTGCDRLLHAGDVGGPEVLEALAVRAPLVAVRGNNDHGPWAERLPEVATVEAGGLALLLLHDASEVRRRFPEGPAAAGFAAVIAGHSHRPRCERADGVLWFNPGSAGPRRFRLPVAVGRLRIARGAIEGEIVELAVPPTANAFRKKSPPPH